MIKILVVDIVVGFPDHVIYWISNSHVRIWYTIFSQQNMTGTYHTMFARYFSQCLQEALMNFLSIYFLQEQKIKHMEIPLFLDIIQILIKFRNKRKDRVNGKFNNRKTNFLIQKWDV